MLNIKNHFNLADFKHRFLLLLCICCPLIGCDQVTKVQALTYLADKGRLSFWGDAFRLEYASNTGAWGGLGSQLPEPWRHLLLTVMVGFFLLGLLIYLLIQIHPFLFFSAFSFVLAGGIGNLMDRAYHGYVIDFLNMGIGSLRTNIFNVADVAIMIGIGLLIIHYIREKEKPPEINSA